jgi:hypothetical protein
MPDPFRSVLDELGDLHDAKGADYGRTQDPYANVRASEDFGVEPWVGALIRANDKMRRLQNAAKGKKLTNEGVEDSLRDLAVYAIIALILWQESQPQPVQKALDELTELTLNNYPPFKTTTDA